MDKSQTVSELATQIASNPKAASAVAAYSTAVGTVGLVTDLKDWLSIVSLVLGIVLSSVMIAINVPKLIRIWRGKPE
jgi:hypothetical protein